MATVHRLLAESASARYLRFGKKISVDFEQRRRPILHCCHNRSHFFVDELLSFGKLTFFTQLQVVLHQRIKCRKVLIHAIHQGLALRGHKQGLHFASFVHRLRFLRGLHLLSYFAARNRHLCSCTPA